MIHVTYKRDGVVLRATFNTFVKARRFAQEIAREGASSIEFATA